MNHNNTSNNNDNNIIRHDIVIVFFIIIYDAQKWTQGSLLIRRQRGHRVLLYRLSFLIRQIISKEGM